MLPQAGAERVSTAAAAAAGTATKRARREKIFDTKRMHERQHRIKDTRQKE